MNDRAFNERELATVLAALRLFQRTDSAHSGPENDIATNGGEFEPLTNAEIDVLCERVNVIAPVANDLQAAEELAHACHAVWAAREAGGYDPVTFSPNLNYHEAVKRADINPSLREPVTCLLVAGYQETWLWANEIRNGIFPQVESLRAADMDQARLAAAVHALQADPAIDAAKAGLIARAYTGRESEQYATREEAFRAIEATFSKWHSQEHPQQNRAETHVFSHLDRLHGAGADETRFDEAFRLLQTDPAMDVAKVSKIARAYAGDDGAQHATREDALYAIERQFYQAREQEAGQAVEQTAARGGRS